MIDVYTKLKDVCHKLNKALIQWNFKDCVPLSMLNLLKRRGVVKAPFWPKILVKIKPRI